MNSFILISILSCLYVLYHRSRKRWNLPPGPKGYPIIGNIYDIPPREEWIAYKAMSEKYSEFFLQSADAFVV